MRNAPLFIALLLVAGSASAQVPVYSFAAAPTPGGSCSPAADGRVRLVKDTGVIWCCTGGTPTWQSCGTSSATSSVPIFSVFRSAAQQSLPDGAFTTVLFDTEAVDTAAAYSTATGKFTAPVAGRYQFDAAVAVTGAQAAAMDVMAEFVKNGSRTAGNEIRGARLQGGATYITAPGVTVSATLDLAAGDTIEVICYVANGGNANLKTEGYLGLSHFSGFMVAAVGPGAAGATVPTVMAHRSTTGQSMTNVAMTTLILDVKDLDTHNAYNAGTGVFTVPEAGRYQVDCGWQLANLVVASAGEIFLSVYKGATEVSRGQRLSISNVIMGTTVSALVDAAAGDTLTCAGYQSNGAARLTESNAAPVTFFHAVKIPLSGMTPDATATTSGGVKLTGDLGGIAASPQVTGLHLGGAVGYAGQAAFSGGGPAPYWADAPRLSRLTSSYTNATTTLTDTALSWAIAASTLSGFSCKLFVTNSSTTGCCQVAANGPTSASALYNGTWFTSHGVAPATAGALNTVLTGALDTALGPTTCLAATSQFTLEGRVSASASPGNVTIQAKAAAAGTCTIGAGSYCEFWSY
jgi:hypothetical protein